MYCMIHNLFAHINPIHKLMRNVSKYVYVPHQNKHKQSIISHSNQNIDVMRKPGFKIGQHGNVIRTIGNTFS